MTRRLLIVDDNQEFRTMLKSYLVAKKVPFEIYEANSAEMAVTKASFIKPHVILMDINLPHANGLAATREILNENPETKLIIVTMFEIDVFKKAAEDVKAVDFIAKSEIYDKLIPSLNKCFNMTSV